MSSKQLKDEIARDERQLDFLMMEMEAIQLQMDMTARALETKRQVLLERELTEYVAPIVPLKFEMV